MDWDSYGQCPLGTMHYVHFSFGKFWIRFWFYAYGCDTCIVSFHLSNDSERLVFRFLNQPMFKYNQEQGFDTMNYIMTGLCTLILLAPVACIMKEHEMANLDTIDHSDLEVNNRLVKNEDRGDSEESGQQKRRQKFSDITEQKQ